MDEDAGRSDTSRHVLIALFIAFLSLLLYFLKRKLTRGNTVLIVGLSDSGKTLLFSKLVSRNRTPETYTSLMENRCDLVSVGSEKLVTLVDFPGSERLRKQLYDNYFHKNQKNPLQGRNSLKGIVFVIDSTTFSKTSRDVAAFLYDILYESRMK
ncbi:unnamed protein product, partial [Gongylonema pulchrum]|uniref:Signal recognition particle receptor subunit beta n=1 Tax=Gongylonema pulchrum TaxID=637853 RepID=A0A183DFP4_9BILA